MKSFLHTQWAAPGANHNCYAVQIFGNIHHITACLHAFVRRGFVGDEDIRAGVLFVGGEDLLFVVAALGVDFQGVEFRAAEESAG